MQWHDGRPWQMQSHRNWTWCTHSQDYRMEKEARGSEFLNVCCEGHATDEGHGQPGNHPGISIQWPLQIRQIRNIRILPHSPATRQEALPVNLHRGLARQLMSCQVSVVRGVDEVVRERLVHVVAEIQLIRRHNGIVVSHEIPVRKAETETAVTKGIISRCLKW